MDRFTHAYNHEHHHTGIGLHTPADVHYGQRCHHPVDAAAAEEQQSRLMADEFDLRVRDVMAPNRVRPGRHTGL